MYIYIYVYTYVYTYIHVHTHTHTRSGLERPDSSSHGLDRLDRPQLPDYYTPFAGSLVGKLDEMYTSTIHGLVSQYSSGTSTPDGRRSLYDSSNSGGGSQGWMTKGDPSTGGVPFRKGSSDIGADDCAAQHLLAPYGGSGDMHTSFLSEHARRALQNAAGASTCSDGRPASLPEQIVQMQQQLEQELALKNVVEQENESLRHKNADLFQQIGQREPASQFEQDEKVAALEDELRLLCLELRQVCICVRMHAYVLTHTHIYICIYI